MSNSSSVMLLGVSGSAALFIAAAAAAFVLYRKKNPPSTATDPVTAASPPAGPAATTGAGGGGGGTGKCPAGWSQANGTIYSSWPKDGSKECTDFEGCKWAGTFASLSADGKNGGCAAGAAKLSGGNGTPKICRFTPEAVKKMRMASTTQKDFKRLKGKDLEVMIEGRPTKVITVQVRDYCLDKDCPDDNCDGKYKGCCSKHSDNGKYTLLDLEANMAGQLLGADLSKEDVGGPYQAQKQPKWSYNNRAGLPSCISGHSTMPLCYRIK